MDLKALRYFATLAEELHFGRAAKRLHISQPPLSRQIRLLEKDVGTLLLRRTSRNVELTRAGEVFYKHVMAILATMQRARSETYRAECGEIGSLSIGFFRGAMYALLPEVLRTFRAQVPDAKLLLREMETRDVPQTLIEGRIDVGFLRPPVADALIATELALREPVVVAIPEGNPLCSRARLHLRDLADQPFVAYDSDSPLRHKIMNACYKTGFNPKIVEEARYPETLIGLVRAGAGIALVSASHQTRGARGVMFKAVIGPLPTAEIVVAWRKADHSAMVCKILEITRKARKTVSEK